jgi:hypothetical protein
VENVVELEQGGRGGRGGLSSCTSGRFSLLESGVLGIKACFFRGDGLAGSAAVTIYFFSVLRGQSQNCIGNSTNFWVSPFDYSYRSGFLRISRLWKL